MERQTRNLSTVALAGIVWFVVTVLVLPIIQQPEYDIVSQAISETVLGRFGFLQTIAFCVLGVGTLALAAALRASVARAVVGPTLLVLAGLLDFVSAAFPTVGPGAAPTTASTVHQVAGMVTFVATILAMFAFGRSFRGSDRWRSFSRPTLVWAVIAAACFIVLGPKNFPDQFGITQRLMAASFLTWMVAAASRIRSLATVEAASVPLRSATSRLADGR